MAGGTNRVSSNDYSQRALVGMNKSNTKSKTFSEEKNPLLAVTDSCSQIQLDTADFLIDGANAVAKAAEIVVCPTWPVTLRFHAI